MKTALMFAGQGSQYVGMAKDLYEAHPDVRAMLDAADQQLGFALSSLMFDGPVELLTETRNTQPALFAHEAALLAVTGIAATADCVAGHSLGEYSALHSAGVLSFEDALRLVRLRGELMFAAGQTLPGTMAAVVGLEDDVVRSICDELQGGADKVIVAANFNAPGQVVISGSAEHVRACMPVFKERGAKMVKELQVSGAFHSPLLETARLPLAEALAATTFTDARIDVYVNVSAQPLRSGADLREAAIAQLTSAVLWTQTMQNMASNGVTRFVEIGPGKVLQGLVKRTVSDVQIDGIDTIADVERYLQTSSGVQ